jgi:glycogen(starch) synthase
VETFVTNLVRALQRQGVELAVVTDGSVAMELTDPYPISMIPMTIPLKSAEPAAMVQAIAAIRRVVTRFKPDVIHYNMCGGEIFFFERVMRSLDIPYVLTLHNNAFSGGAVAGLFKRLIDKASAVTAVSSAVLSAAGMSLGDSAAKIRLIANALPSRSGSAAYLANGRILALGRIVREKGFDTLVEAFSRIRDSHPDARLVIAGQGPELSALQAQAESLMLGDAVVFPGWIDPEEVHAEMGKAAIIVFPSRWDEPFGLVALEAAQALRPCVATAVGELPSIVRDGETGFIVPPEDPSAMAAALSRLLDHPAEAEEMGLRAKQWGDRQFNFEAMVSAYLQLFAQARAARG